MRDWGVDPNRGYVMTGIEEIVFALSTSAGGSALVEPARTLGNRLREAVRRRLPDRESQEVIQSNETNPKVLMAKISEKLRKSGAASDPELIDLASRILEMNPDGRTYIDMKNSGTVSGQQIQNAGGGTVNFSSDAP